MEIFPLTCDGCGVCCEEQGLPPGYAVPALLTFLPQELRDEIERAQEEEREAGRTRHQRGLPCIWHDAETKRCLQYEHRPAACRDAPVGGHSCRFWRERRGLDQSGGTGVASEPYDGSREAFPRSNEMNEGRRVIE